MKDDAPLALIPARAGSERFPGKHLAPLGGKPLLAWTIQAAAESGIFKRILVSSDGAEILAVASRHGAEVHARTKRDAGHAVPLVQIGARICWDVRHHRGAVYVLLPTCPFRRPKSIHEAWEVFQGAPRAQALLSLATCRSPYSALAVGADRYVKPLWPREFLLPRQRHGRAFRHDGGHWILRSPDVFGCGFALRTIPFFPADPMESMDIDTAEDLDYARWLLERHGKR